MTLTLLFCLSLFAAFFAAAYMRSSRSKVSNATLSASSTDAQEVIPARPIVMNRTHDFLSDGDIDFQAPDCVKGGAVGGILPDPQPIKLAASNSVAGGSVRSEAEDARDALLVPLEHASRSLSGTRFNTHALSPDVSKFNSGMRRLLVGQEDAIESLTEVIQVAKAGLSTPGRPLANFLFLGPTGVGKTRALEVAAQVLTGSEAYLMRVDCGELQHSHEIARLIGSPPGYLGHRDTKPPIDNARINEYKGKATGYDIALVLFDEIEKASDAVWNLLLGILDKATLTLGTNERVDFSRCIIGMSSNLGARELVSAIDFGFIKKGAPSKAQKENVGLNAARKKFSPEFFNRLDKIITFGTLDKEQLRIILGLEMWKVSLRVKAINNLIGLFYTQKLEDLLVTEGLDERYGARPLKRAIHRRVVMPLSSILSTQQIKPGMACDILADYDQAKDEVYFVPLVG